MGLLMLNGIPYSGFTEPSNIYSTTEREVGVWIDGKPLYEKTYSGSTPNSNTCQILDVDSIKIIHNACGRLYFANSSIEIGSYLNASYYSGWYQDFTNNGILDIFYSNDYKNANYEITIQYTKTADVPGSGKYAPDGSVMHHYSTDEHVIGTWVDGKTLYEKTALISNIQVPSNNYAQITLSDYFSNVSKVINYECMTDTGDPIPKIYIDSSDAPYSTSAIIELYSDAIIFSRGGGGSATFNAYVTLRYTKTS